MLVGVSGTYRGYQIVGCTPCSAGGVHLVEMLNILEHFDVEGMGFGTVEGQPPTTPLFPPLFDSTPAFSAGENRAKGLLEISRALEVIASSGVC